MNENQNVCPHCENHCASGHPLCPKGLAYFGQAAGNITEKNAVTVDERAILLLRKCGHYLHHSANPREKAGEGPSLAGLSPTEKETLISLLEKCLAYWQS